MFTCVPGISIDRYIVYHGTRSLHRYIIATVLIKSLVVQYSTVCRYVVCSNIQYTKVSKLKCCFNFRCVHEISFPPTIPMSTDESTPVTTRASKLAVCLHQALKDAAAAELLSTPILKKKQFKQVESRYIVKFVLVLVKVDTRPQVLSEDCRFAAATMGTIARLYGLGVGGELADDLCSIGPRVALRYSSETWVPT